MVIRFRITFVLENITILATIFGVGLFIANVDTIPCNFISFSSEHALINIHFVLQSDDLKKRKITLHGH